MQSYKKMTYFHKKLFRVNFPRTIGAIFYMIFLSLCSKISFYYAVFPIY